MSTVLKQSVKTYKNLLNLYSKSKHSDKIVLKSATAVYWHKTEVYTQTFHLEASWRGVYHYLIRQCVSTCNKYSNCSGRKGGLSLNLVFQQSVPDISHLHILHFPFKETIFWPPLWSSGQSSWLQTQRSEFNSRCYQIFWEVVGRDQGPLSLVNATEELLGRNSGASSLDSREYGCRDPSCWPCGTLYPQKVGTNFADKRCLLSRHSLLTESDYGV
jgi:hypothetical protein